MPTTAATTTAPARAPGADTRKAADADARADAERRREALVDAEIEQSFPASDPPGWTLGTH